MVTLHLQPKSIERCMNTIQTSKKDLNGKGKFPNWIVLFLSKETVRFNCIPEKEDSKHNILRSCLFTFYKRES